MDGSRHWEEGYNRQMNKVYESTEVWNSIVCLGNYKQFSLVLLECVSQERIIKRCWSTRQMVKF